jgi:hypothetical protein
MANFSRLILALQAVDYKKNTGPSCLEWPVATVATSEQAQTTDRSVWIRLLALYAVQLGRSFNIFHRLGSALAPIH